MTSKLNIRKPDSTPAKPDRDTLTAPDFTSDTAASRVLYLNWRWFRYGTDDQGHAAALMLSVLLLFVIGVVIIAGLLMEHSDQSAMWMDRVFTWLGGAFLFVAGVAIGKSIGQ